MVIRCIGTNDYNMNHNVFRNLFIKECHLLGTPTRIVDLGHMILAEVENGRN